MAATYFWGSRSPVWPSAAERGTASGSDTFRRKVSATFRQKVSDLRHLHVPRVCFSHFLYTSYS
eukprot:3456426-Prymnesium_polylepis.1